MAPTIVWSLICLLYFSFFFVFLQGFLSLFIQTELTHLFFAFLLLLNRYPMQYATVNFDKYNFLGFFEYRTVWCKHSERTISVKSRFNLNHRISLSQHTNAHFIFFFFFSILYLGLASIFLNSTDFQTVFVSFSERRPFTFIHIQ